MLYVYAITDAEARIGDVHGHSGAPVALIAERGLAAAVSPLEEPPGEVTEAQAWGHESVVEALMEAGPVLPMRLGTVLADEEDVRTFLGEREHELRTGLARVTGAVELAVRAAVEPAAEQTSSPRPKTGTDYLLGRLEAQRSTSAAVQRFHGPLSRMARASAVRLGGRDHGTVTASYLVDADLVEAFRAEVEHLERDEPSLTCTGPWPPYSFVDAEGSQ